MKMKDAPLEGVLSDKVPEPETPMEHLAHIISLVGSPPMMALYAMAAVAIHLADPQGWIWAGLYLLLSVLAPLIFLLAQVRLGQVTDLDVHLREQRQGSLIATTVGSALAWTLMTIGQAPGILRFMTSLAVLQWLAIYGITLHWKISVHSASATGITLYLLRALGTVALPVFLVLPLVAWSRVKLRRHTPLQTLAGIGLGLTVFLLVSGLFLIS